MIVAVGMLTILLWKVFTTITDRREFAQFEQESKKMASVYLGLRLLHGLQVSHVTGILFTLFTTTSSSPRRVTRAQLCLTSCLSAAHHS